MRKTHALLLKDIAHAIAMLTGGRAEADTHAITFRGGRVTDLTVDQRNAHFRLVLEHVNTNQLSVILGLLQQPPVIDLTAITMEPDGTSIAFKAPNVDGA